MSIEMKIDMNDIKMEIMFGKEEINYKTELMLELRSGMLSWLTSPSFYLNSCMRVDKMFCKYFLFLRNETT
jgi:uncharacterized membrane protein YvbJ